MPSMYARRVLAPGDRPTTVGSDPGPYVPPKQRGGQPPAPWRGPSIPGDAYDAGPPPEPPRPQVYEAPEPPPVDLPPGHDPEVDAYARAAADPDALNPILDLAMTPYTGGKRTLRGLATIGRAFPTPEVDTSLSPTEPEPRPIDRPSWRETARGASDILGGGMEASTLLGAVGLAKAPLRVGAALVGGSLTMEAVKAAGTKMGIPEEYVDLAADVLGIAGGAASERLAASPAARAKLLTEAKRLYFDETGAVKLPGGRGAPKVVKSADDLARVAEAVPVGKGATEGAKARAVTADPLVPPPAPPMSRALDALGSKSEVLKVAKGLFPRLDAYGKPSGLISRKTILKRLETMQDLAPEVKASLTDLADKIGDRRIQPDELHALASGKDYTPDRVIRKVKPIAEGEKQIPGAPLGVSNARQARGLRERYLGGIEEGMAGRDWYHDTGESILFHANDDPARARLVAGDIAITSPATSVSANTGMGVKGYNQANAGVDVEAGRFPTAMGKRIEELHTGAEGSLGLKRDPFAENMAIGGGFQEVPPVSLSPGVDLITPPKKTRAVHDIWDGELHGYMNPDGTPMRTGFGPAQHRFMDRQQDKIVATANQRALGGHTNWNDLRTQAAGWTGAKIAAGDISPQDAALSPADYFKQHYAQGSRETLPGPTTGHMPQLLQRGMEPFRQHLHNTMMNEAGVYDSQGRDQIAPGFGGLVGRAFEGPGLFKGEISPGMQTRVLTGAEDVPGGPTGARQVDEGSRRLMNATEATYALGMGQDVGAWSRNLPAGSGAPRGLWDVALPGGTITNDQMKWLARRFPNIGDMAVISTDDGVRLGSMDPATMKAIVKMLGGTVKQAGVGLETGLASGYLPNNWKTHRAGQDLLDPIRQIARGPERFNEFAPAMFDRIRRADAMFRRDTGGRFSLSQMRDELLGTVAGEGFAGLERLAKKYALPVALLVAGLQALGQPVPQGAPPPPSQPGSSPASATR